MGPVERVGRPFHLLQAVHALEVEHVGIGAVEAGRLGRAVEVHHQVMPGARGGGKVEEIVDELVVAVHEVDLEALDAHVGIMLADLLHVALEGRVSGPQDEAYVALPGVLH